MNLRVWQKRPLLHWPRLVKCFGSEVKQRSCVRDSAEAGPEAASREKGPGTARKGSGLTVSGRTRQLLQLGHHWVDVMHLLSPQHGWTGRWVRALNLLAGRPPRPGQPPHHSPPVFSGAALVSALPPAWSPPSGRAGAPPAPGTSPTGCDSWRL